MRRRGRTTTAGLPAPYRARAALLAAVLALAGLAVAGPAGASTDLRPVGEPVRLDGSVSAMLAWGGRVYAAGGFSNVGGQSLGRLGTVDAATGGDPRPGPAPALAGPSSADVGGWIGAAVADGSSGWFVTGAFDRLGGRPAAGLAHLLADGSVDPTFTAPPVPPAAAPLSSPYSGMAAAAGRVWVSGQGVDGDPRSSGTIVLDGTSGAVVRRVPGLGLAGSSPDGATVYLRDRSYRTWSAFDAASLARLRTVTLPAEFRFGSALAISGSTAYFAGSVDARTHRRLLVGADLLTGARRFSVPLGRVGTGAASFAPPVLAFAGGRLLLMGSVSTVAGRRVGALTELDPDSGRPRRGYVTELLPGSVVDGVAAAPGRLYVLGARSPGAGRDHIAAIDPASGRLLDAFRPGAGSQMAATPSGGRLLLWSHSDIVVGATTRRGLAAFDAATGRPDLGFDAGLLPSPANGMFVGALAVSRGRVVAGGAFTAPDGGRNLALLEAAAGSPAGAVARPDGDVLALAVTGARIYAGGGFGRIGGLRRPWLAAIDLRGRVDRRFAPAPSGPVRALAVAGGRLAAGGEFARLGGLRRRGLAAVSLATGRASAAFDARLACDFRGCRPVVWALAARAGRLYALGYFNDPPGDPFAPRGEDRQGVAAVSPATGRRLKRFAPARRFNGDERPLPSSFALSSRRLYLPVSTFGPAGLAELSLTTGAEIGFLRDDAGVPPGGIPPSPYALAITANGLLVAESPGADRIRRFEGVP